MKFFDKKTSLKALDAFEVMRWTNSFPIIDSSTEKTIAAHPNPRLLKKIFQLLLAKDLSYLLFEENYISKLLAHTALTEVFTQLKDDNNMNAAKLIQLLNYDQKPSPKHVSNPDIDSVDSKWINAIYPEETNSSDEDEWQEDWMASAENSGEDKLDDEEEYHYEFDYDNDSTVEKNTTAPASHIFYYSSDDEKLSSSKSSLFSSDESPSSPSSEKRSLEENEEEEIRFTPLQKKKK